MSSDVPYVRYEEAAGKLESVVENLKSSGRTLVRVGQALSERPDSLLSLVDGVAENWTAVRNDPNAVVGEDWTDFEQLQTMLKSYRDAKEQEQRAWNNLGADRQKRLNRPPAALRR